MRDSSDYLPEVVYEASQVSALDARFIDDFGVDGYELMQRAARAAFDELAHYWAMPGRMTVLCGPGNNGGDGFLVASLAMAAGWTVTLESLVDADEIGGDAARAVKRFRETGGLVSPFADTAIEADVVVDALLGTGVNRDVEGDIARAIERINDAGDRGAGVFAVDIPSGIDATTGHVWRHAVRADATTTFIGLKLGMLTGEGPAHCGELAFSALDAPDALYRDAPYVARRLTHRALRRALVPRSRNVHKGDNGHVLCIGGNRGFGGAIRMTAEAALRSGAGLVSVACHPDHAGAMSQARPELMCRGIAPDERPEALIAAADVLAIGPGLGADDWGRALWQAAMDSDKPLVVDADALNQLAQAPRARGRWILTPHPGEAGRLLGCSTAEVMDDRVGTAQAIARRYDAVTVLKGAGSLIATPEELWLCTDGNPGMAVGGMGDLLTGVIAALHGQGLDIGTAAGMGVYVHARAGDAAADAAGQRGLLPMDLLDWLRHYVNPART
ncbi:carbohydrate kinase [Salinisphaera orenii MK-B5]|uniref:Bifunctional NAD(P)H-hydrate repair enzyme n=2 Tax=Salinisphaera orenii TaxID=856731 RepID=A0A423PU60_9GAMM|nr:MULTISPECIES: NAD(P)H-hydrate dehydratase [Salinisphaera]ROO29062.1 carbohydrate kinase [Salinisphaera orenii MK-B5]ROO37481.1 carbohydrate kinase [Salinisphaera halophila YIM 95161]